MKTISFVLTVLLLVLSGRIQAGDAEKEWTCTLRANGIAHYERWVAVTDRLSVRERRVEMELDGDLEQVTRFLLNPESSSQWMRGVKTVTVISPASGTESTSLAHMVFNFPWPFKDQDMVAQYRLARQSEDKRLILISSQPDAAPDCSDFIRIRDYRASWELSRTGAKQIRIVFTVFSREAPRFPRVVQDPIVKRMFRDNFNELKNLLCIR